MPRWRSGERQGPLTRPGPCIPVLLAEPDASACWSVELSADAKPGEIASRETAMHLQLHGTCRGAPGWKRGARVYLTRYPGSTRVA